MTRARVIGARSVQEAQAALPLGWVVYGRTRAGYLAKGTTPVRDWVQPREDHGLIWLAAP